MSHFSSRIIGTQAPCIVEMGRLMAQRSDIKSLAQGVVYWKPPKFAFDFAASKLSDDECSSYGNSLGIPQLRQALKDKLARKNNLHNHEVVVTAGANQAYTNIVGALCDGGKKSVLFQGYYFNHIMAHSMHCGIDSVLISKATEGFQLDMEVFKKTMENNDVGLVTLSNPCNPTGEIYPVETLQQISDICKKHKAWLVVDNTYEDFNYTEEKLSTLPDSHVLNLFSFSKAYGMMGWRVGYLAVHESHAGHPPTAEQQNSEEKENSTTEEKVQKEPLLMDQLLKVQDTTVICASVSSQQIALGALLDPEHDALIAERVSSLQRNRELVAQVLRKHTEPGELMGGKGALYYFAKLKNPNDKEFIENLALKYGVAVIPGSDCGTPGYFRVAFGNLEYEECRAACDRLDLGLRELNK